MPEPPAETFYFVRSGKGVQVDRDGINIGNLDALVTLDEPEAGFTDVR